MKEIVWKRYLFNPLTEGNGWSEIDESFLKIQSDKIAIGGNKVCLNLFKGEFLKI